MEFRIVGRIPKNMQEIVPKINGSIKNEPMLLYTLCKL